LKESSGKSYIQCEEKMTKLVHKLQLNW